MVQELNTYTQFQHLRATQNTVRRFLCSLIESFGDSSEPTCFISNAPTRGIHPSVLKSTTLTKPPLSPTTAVSRDVKSNPYSRTYSSAGVANTCGQQTRTLLSADTHLDDHLKFLCRTNNAPHFVFLCTKFCYPKERVSNIFFSFFKDGVQPR